MGGQKKNGGGKGEKGEDGRAWVAQCSKYITYMKMALWNPVMKAKIERIFALFFFFFF